LLAGEATKQMKKMNKTNANGQFTKELDDLLDDVDKQNAEDLLKWCDNLDFDKYLLQWQTLATTSGSESGVAVSHTQVQYKLNPHKPTAYNDGKNHVNTLQSMANFFASDKLFSNTIGTQQSHSGLANPLGGTQTTINVPVNKAIVLPQIQVAQSQSASPLTTSRTAQD